MLIVVIMGKWSDDSACCVIHDVRLYSVLDTVVISGDDVVVFDTLVAVFVFSVMWSELLMTSAISFHCGHRCTSAREWSERSHIR